MWTFNFPSPQQKYINRKERQKLRLAWSLSDSQEQVPLFAKKPSYVCIFKFKKYMKITGLLIKCLKVNKINFNQNYQIFFSLREVDTPQTFELMKGKKIVHIYVQHQKLLCLCWMFSPPVSQSSMEDLLIGFNHSSIHDNGKNLGHRSIPLAILLKISGRKLTTH